MTELLGHAQVQRHFIEAMHAGRLHHAWLMHGIKGIGKRMLADKLALQFMCEDGSGCGECHACRMQQAGSHPDTYHVGLPQGKRDISIEQIRDVLEFLSLSGTESERRIVILDDAERMNAQAANALLKGLEEPAAGSFLLIACSDVERLPATVRSRCLLQHCVPLSDMDVRKILAGMGIAAEHLDLAVSLAEGAPGRVQCMQDKVVAAALKQWQQLTADVAQADLGEMESWVRQHVGLVPHDLIARVLTLAVYPVLQSKAAASDFQAYQALHQALLACLRWPADVIRHSLRPAPSLLADLLTLRMALRAMSQSG